MFVTEIPFGWRRMTEDEVHEYSLADSHDFGWMRVENCGVLLEAGGPVMLVKWDCMIEFGMDHDHDAVECETIMANMNPDCSVSEHYDDNGIKEYY